VKQVVIESLPSQVFFGHRQGSGNVRLLSFERKGLQHGGSGYGAKKTLLPKGLS